MSDLQSEILFEVSIKTQKPAAGLFSVALVVTRESQISNLKLRNPNAAEDLRSEIIRRPAVSGLAAL
jgi:hypothetical protein